MKHSAATRVDRNLLVLTAFLRALAAGMSGVLLSLFLERVHGCDAVEIGMLLSLGLIGGLVAMLIISRGADRFGRRRFLALLGLLSALGSATLAVSHSFAILTAAFLLGMVNGMGRDRGAATILDQAILPQTTDELRRTEVFARYHVWVDAGHALGALLGILPSVLQGTFSLGLFSSYRATFLVSAGLLLPTAVIPLFLSPAVEVANSPQPRGFSAQSRRRIAGLSVLSGIDSFGGGLFAGAILSYWFYKRFDVDEAWLGPLFFAARVINGASHLAAAWLARRIGLLRTMVCTHIPSSLLLMAATFAPTFPIAVALYLAREGLAEMDLPTRQSYLMAIVRPEERVVAAGFTTMVRNFAWMLAPALAGPLMQAAALSAPIYSGAGLKILYDVLLYAGFRKVHPPEESPALLPE
jgi:MFS family permease